jgi:hypothetical protein
LAVYVKITVFQDVTPFCLVSSIVLEDRAVIISRVDVNFTTMLTTNQTTRCHNTEHHNLGLDHRKAHESSVMNVNASCLAF